MIGPVATAGAQFLLSLLLLARLDVADFGSFAFLLVTSQFSIGLWSALFCAPLLVAAAHRDGGRSALRALAAVSLLALLPVALAFFAMASVVGAPMGVGAAFASFAALLLLRQFARAWSLAHGHGGVTIMSDVTYGAVLLAGTAWLAMARGGSLQGAFLALLAAVVIALVPFLGGTLPQVMRGLAWADVPAYRALWRRDARWSLAGVVTTEVTVNSHSYFVTVLRGAVAFAPIAATALLIRPITVALNGLVEFERARFAHALAAGDWPRVRRERRQLRVMLLVVWTGTLLLAAGCLAAFPQILSQGRYDRATVLTGAALWFAVALARCAHAAEGAVLQAAGHFRQLAWISSWTALVSLVAVPALLLLAGPLWSIGGIVLGEACFAAALFLAVRRMFASAGHGGQPC